MNVFLKWSPGCPKQSEQKFDELMVEFRKFNGFIDEIGGLAEFGAFDKLVD